MDLAEKVQKAQADREACSQLIGEYHNFIATCANKSAGRYVTEHDDEMSIAMVAFNEAIQKYDNDKGNFLSFASLMIKNRVIDYIRKEYKSAHVMPISSLSQTDKDGKEIEFDIEDSRDNDIKYEVEALQHELRRFNISFVDLSKDTPKAKKTKLACFKAINYIIRNPGLISELMKHYTLPIKQITDNLDIQRKILERHRKYIITAVIILNGDFSGLAGYFNGVKEATI